MRGWKKVVSAVVVLAVAVVAAGVAIIKSLDFNEYRSLIAEQVKAATGREMTIAGKLDLNISLTPALAVEGVTFANAPWGTRREMATLKQLAAEVELLPLLTGDVRVKRLVLVGLDVLVETDATGRGNWQLAPAGKAEAAKPEAETATRLPVVHAVRMKDVAVAYRDGRTGKTTTLRLARLDVEEKGLEAPMTVAMAGDFDGKPFEASGRLGSLKALVEGGVPYPVSLAAEALGAEVAIEGVVSEPRAMTGLDLKVRASGKELAATLDAVRPLIPDLRQAKLPEIGPFRLAARLQGAAGSLALTDIDASAGQPATVRLAVTGRVADPMAAAGIDVAIEIEGRNARAFSGLAGADLSKLPPFAVTARVKGADKVLKLEDLVTKLGDSDLSGRAALSLAGPRPVLTAALASNRLRLDDLAQGARPEKPKSPDGRVFADDPLPLDALRVADAKVSLSVGRLIADGLTVEDVSLGLTLVDGRLALRPLNARLAGGTVAAHATVDVSRDRSPTLAIGLDAGDIGAGKLTAALLRTDWLQGAPLAATVDLKANGGSVRALMASLEGEAVVTLGEGTVRSTALTVAGADLLTQVISALNPFTARQETTPLRCGVARFLFKDGVAEARNGIAVETGQVNLVGSGQIDLRTEGLDFAFRPEARRGLGLSLADVASVVRLSGTLAEPGISLGKLDAARGAATVGAAIATGGLSLLAQGLLGRAASDPAPCRTALGQASPDKASAPQDQPADTAGSTADKIEKKLDEIGKGIGGALKGLFGK